MDRPGGRTRSAARGARGDDPGHRQFLTIAADRPFALDGGGRLTRRRHRLRDVGRARRRRPPTPCSSATPWTGDSHVAGPAGPRPPDARLVGGRRRARAGRSTPTATSSCAPTSSAAARARTGPASPDPATGRPVRLALPGRHRSATWCACQARLADHLGIERWLTRRRRLDGRHAGARVGRSPTRSGCGRSSPIATCAQATAQQIAWGAIGRRAIRARPQLARRRLLRRRARRRSARGPGHRPHGGPGHVPLRQRRSPTGSVGSWPRASTTSSTCGSASRSSATSTTTATSWSAASTPTATS